MNLTVTIYDRFCLAMKINSWRIIIPKFIRESLNTSCSKSFSHFKMTRDTLTHKI